MIFGVFLKTSNAIYFRKPLDFFFECIPMIIFAFSLFGYMVFLIFYKWSIDWNNGTNGMFGPVGKLFKARRMRNVVVIIIRDIFISTFFFYCLLCKHSFPTNPNSSTNCFKSYSLSVYKLYKLHLLNAFVYFWFLITVH